jgi:hypothetical protein
MGDQSKSIGNVFSGDRKKILSVEKKRPLARLKSDATGEVVKKVMHRLDKIEGKV